MLSISIIKRFRDALLLLAIGIFGVAQADGPVSVANLPGGGGSVLVDTDVTEGGGLGQRWGRAGGRTITYHVASPGTFSALSFGVTQAAAQPHVAFDGTVNAGEVLSYNAGLSTPAGGIAVWSGSALLQLVNQPPFPVATRLTMKVTNASNSPVGMGFEGGPSPVANVLSAGDFKVNLLFEMADVGNANVFHPVLDY